MSVDFFKNNRKSLTEAVDGQLTVLSGWHAMQQRGDQSASFCQESNLWYLTGIEEPGWQLIIDGAQQKSWLVAPERSQASQIFDGGISHDEAKRISGVDEVIARNEADSLLRTLVRQHKTVFTLGEHPYADHFDFVLNPAPQKLWQRLEAIFDEVKDCRPILDSLRAIKQPEEIELIRAAVDLTVDAFQYVKQKINNFKYEYEIEAEFSHFFRSRGAHGHAYEPIVASGANANILHYSVNNAVLPKNGLVLLDIGARLGGYNADITRTFAIGQLSEREAQVHVAVKRAHEQIIDLLGPGASVEDYQYSVDEIMKRELKELGLLRSPDDNMGYRRYFPHAISHGLGIDVHDSLGKPDVFKPGMVLTVEPGIYIPEEGIGVRLEDNILITESGYDNLSADLSLEL